MAGIASKVPCDGQAPISIIKGPLLALVLPIISTSLLSHYKHNALFTRPHHTLAFKMFTKTIAALSIAALALADSETFGLVVIRSGSQYQYSSISAASGEFAIGTDNYVEGVITDDGLFKLSDGSYAVVQSDGTILTGAEGSSPFAITDGYLAYQGSEAFAIDNNLVVVGSSEGTSVALRATLATGSAASDFSPSGSSSNDTVPVTPPTTNSSNDTTSTTYTFETANSAGSLAGAGVGALVAAAAALLL